MLALITSALKVIAIALGWAKREEEKKEDFQIARGADLEQTHASDVRSQENRESVHRLSDDELDDRLRSTGAGGTRPSQ